MKKALFLIPLETRFLTGLIVGLLALPSFVRADDFTLSGYTEVGKRSTAEDYEEEDTDDDYTYQNYHLKLEQGVSDRLSYGGTGVKPKLLTQLIESSYTEAV